VRTVGVLAALGVAIVLQATLSGMWMSTGTRVNFVLVAVVYVALAFGAVTGLLAGTVGGLAQDALAGGLVGVGGLSKTIVGFFVGVLGAQFIVAQPIPRFVMFVGATFAHEMLFQGLYALIESRAFTVQYSALLIQAVVNAAVGVLAFQVIEGAPGLLQRRRTQGTVFGRRRY
jgi:rod shape-determining protein MreD